MKNKGYAMKKRWGCIIASVICFCLSFQTVYATDALNVSHVLIKDNSLVAYVQNPGDYKEVKCQIGQEFSKQVNVKKVSDSNKIIVDTYILIDNSLSIQEKYRDTMKQVAKDIVFSKKDNERFTIATFDTENHYLTERNSDSATLIQAIDQITFQNLDTKVVDVLYSLYNKIESDNGDFARIIFMSDGMETKTIGYTREELMDKVKTAAYPVYMLGCAYNSNESELENMFSISRATNATYYHLDKINNADQVAAGIADSFNYVQVKALIPESQRDGSPKGIKITFDSGKDEKSVSLNMTMPFFVAENKEIEIEEPEPTVTPKSEPTPSNINDRVISEESDNQKVSIVRKWNTDLIVPSAILGIIVLALIIVLVNSKKKRKPEKAEPARSNNNDEHTEFLGNHTEIVNDDDATRMEDVITIRLIDKKRPSQIQEYSLDKPIVIGREAGKSQAVFDYEKSISGQHCEIYRVGNQVYVRDLSSTNGTEVDGMPVSDSAELSDGSVIKMGRLQIEFRMI